MIDDRAYYMVFIENEDGTKELPIMLPEDDEITGHSKAADFVAILMDNNIRFRLDVEEGGTEWKPRGGKNVKRVD